MTENELSFLVKDLPTLKGVPAKEIEQHYLSDSPMPLRLRRAGGTFELTKKIPLAPDDMSRFNEITIPLERAEFELLVSHRVRSLQKTRYYFRLDGGLTAELDVFKGPLEGLLMVEVEFPDDASRAAFVPPPWFGRDVSQEAWSANASLAGTTFEALEELIRGE